VVTEDAGQDMPGDDGPGPGEGGGDTQGDDGPVSDGSDDDSNSGDDGNSDGDDDGDPTLEGYRLVWHDEFDLDGMPDESKWNYEDQRPGWVNNELQNYVPRRMENARVED